MGEGREATERHTPMLPLRLFRSSTFSAALFAGLLIDFALSGVLFTLSLLFRQGRGHSAFLPLTLPTAFNPRPGPDRPGAPCRRPPPAPLRERGARGTAAPSPG
ncbi:hypothetical protein [Streptomyces hydrogenans]|uniref:hypothetical protein n=1 Tax=Streptomyces hydrogenans TaxID=1873719 RepID=UPI0037F18243